MGFEQVDTLLERADGSILTVVYAPGRTASPEFIDAAKACWPAAHELAKAVQDWRECATTPWVEGGYTELGRNRARVEEALVVYLRVCAQVNQ